MTQKQALQLFEERRVRTVWDDQQEKWYFSIVDVCQMLTDSDNPRRYWSDLKRKLLAEGSQVYEEIVQLKLRASDGKLRLTDVADTELSIEQAMIDCKRLGYNDGWIKEATHYMGFA